jgi:hypothetical protein
VSSMYVPAQPANNIPMAPSLKNTGGSTVSSLPPTNAPDAYSLASSPTSTAMAESPTSHRLPAWTRTPLPVANTNCNTSDPSHPAGFADPVRADHARKKKSARPDGSGRTASGRDGGRPDQRTEVDTPLAPQDPKGAAAARHSTDAPHDCPAAVSTPLQPADQPQTPGGHS